MTSEQWRRIEELYLAAINLSNEERAALLSGAAPDIRAEVEAMLAQQTVPNLLDRPAWENETQPLAASSPAVGERIGQYQIEAPIGAGGMGVVFRATDTRLHRPVAVKLLSSELADFAARGRFQREAQMASSLNHPHIVTVYDAGELDGRQYLVTELIVGGTLRNWIQKQPRTWEEIAELLTGVADALATAHEAGILHRDVKPENILTTAGGYAKLTDFGIAKLAERRTALDAPEFTETQTQQGMIVGTISYMSPEQASGQPLDGRSDMFSFAVVLYEMLAGRRPFRAPNSLDLIRQVIQASPAPLSDQIPEPVRVLVMKALEKEPADRFQSMREFVVALRSAQRPSGQITPAPSRRPGWIGISVGAVLLAGAFFAAFLLASRRTPSASRPEYIPLTNFTDSAVAPSLSPDGHVLAFIRGNETFIGRGEVYVRLLPQGEPAPLTHDGGTKMGPISFSPDGSRIAYTSGLWETWSVPVLGGEPTRMLAGTEGLSWTSANPPRVMYSVPTGPGLHMGVFTAAESRDGQRAVYMPPDPNGMAHRSFLSPRGGSVIVAEMAFSGWLPCRLVPFDGASAGKLVGPAPAQCTDAAWTPDGEWMYFSINTGDGFHIWRQRYPDGVPEQVTSGATEEQGISFAPDGKSFVTSVGESQSKLWVHDTAGEHQITFEGYAYLPTFSADGSQLYYLQRSNPAGRFVSGELWKADLHSPRKQRLLPGLLLEHYNISPDGKQVIYISAEHKRDAPLWIAPVDGSSPPRRLVNQFCARALFASDGDIYFVGGQPGVMYVQKIRPDGSGLHRIIEKPALFLYDVSPDGKWLAVWVDSEIRIYPVDGGTSKFVCTKCGSAGAEKRGVIPPAISWSRDGKELYLYSEDSNQTYALPLQPREILPVLPASGISWRAEPPKMTGLRVVPHERAFMSGPPGVYAYLEVTTHRNIYRVPIP